MHLQNIAIVFFIPLSVAACTSISIRTAIEIEASPEDGYEVLSDFGAYPEWNPYHRRIEGKFEEGAALKVSVQRPDGKSITVPPHMLRIVKNKEITWGGGIRGIFYGAHQFKLIPTSTGSTLLKHNEDFSGIAVSFIDLPPDVLADGYHLMNIALKEKVENQE